MRWLEEARQDVHFAIRSLIRAKSFTAAVVLTLALGIGANTTIFSLTNAFVLRPVGGLGDVEELFELTDVTSFPAFKDLRASVPAIALAGIRERRIALGHGAGAEHTTGALVSGNFFTVARVGMALGRAFSDADDVAGAAPVGVLGYEYWTRGLGADSSIVGRFVTVNGAPVTVVGVAARDFRGLHLGSVPVILVPINAWTAIAPSSRRPVHLEERGWTWLSVVGRLAPGMTMAQAHSMLANAMKVIMPGTARDEIEQQSAPRPAQAAALASDARDSVVRFAAILATVVVLVLIAACANIAGLLLARAA
ncbi:MAG: ABC transporter permease, partial [Gemmatimonadota bacterium]